MYQSTPYPASTACKCPASTTSKATAKTINNTKAAKKTYKKYQPAEGDKKKRRKICRETYSSYIYKVVYPYNHKENLSTIALKQVHPDTGISNKATCTDHLYGLLPLLAKPLLPRPPRPC
jgi:histone H2B